MDLKIFENCIAVLKKNPLKVPDYSHDVVEMSLKKFYGP